MRTSHVCLGCGFDMCEMRAPLDPAYRLRVVQCPKCKTAAVRRPSRAPWKRTARSALWMALQFVMTALVITIAFGVISEVRPADILRDVRDPTLAMSFVFMGVALVITGAWLGAMLRHIALWKLLLVWAIVLTVLTGLHAIDQPWHKWARLAWRELRMHADAASIVWLITAPVAGLARAMSGNMTQRSIANRLHKRRKKVERIRHT